MEKVSEEEGRARITREHSGIAEQGKVHALRGEHDLALAYYRQAVRRSVEAGEPEIFFRHYLDCIMESLEHTAAYDHVLEYCDKAIAFYDEKPPPNPLAVKDLASIHQRRGAILVQMDRPDEALEAFQKAQEIVRQCEGKLPLADILADWLGRGMHVTPERLRQEQKRHDYFAVRPGRVDAERAIQLPKEVLSGP